MIQKEITKIEASDLQSLVDNAALEGKTLEYKLALPGVKDEQKKEFLADVSSFANASGGDLIIGILSDGESGVPKDVCGIDTTNVDGEIARIDSMIRDGIQPRIPRFQIHSVPLVSGKIVLVLRFGRSELSPHRVTYKGHDKFYSRSSNGKYPLDVTELRNAFVLSQATADRIRSFREDRISRIIANETPVTLGNDAKIALHLIPLGCFDHGDRFDIFLFQNDPGLLAPIANWGFSKRINLDGFVTYADSRPVPHSYVQFFRNGILEAVDATLLYSGEGDKNFNSIMLEGEIIKSTRRYLATLKTVGVELPVALFLSLVNVKGYALYHERGPWYLDSRRIDREILLLPEVQVDSYEMKPQDILRVPFDALWNASGYVKCLNEW